MIKFLRKGIVYEKMDFNLLIEGSIVFAGYRTDMIDSR